MFFGGDPFEHFGSGMHGGPGGPGRASARKDVDTTKLYETLGVSQPLFSYFHFLALYSNTSPYVQFEWKPCFVCISVVQLKFRNDF
mmetsp:Transcript_21371/g.30942  ORF Transcript_21371/g.30942 Transcript_21371/m.30942 type:complete len:86 (-) Transcript_21371:1649-1906(-)